MSRNKRQDFFALGSPPPQLEWTVVTGDTAAFRAYVTDENRNPLNIPDWTIEMDIVRPSTGSLILELFPEATLEDGPGQFTVSLTSEQSDLLQTGDVFDIQMTQPDVVWTIARGAMKMIQDITR